MTSNHVAALLFSLAAIVVAAWLFGAIARRLGQPAVIGEIAGGILMGPTLFGGAISNFLFPTDIRPILTMLAGVGVAIFMFLVGVETEPGAVREQSGTTLAVSLTSVALPFGLGVCLAFYLLPRHPTPQKVGFILMIGIVMAVTAFPVLARILADRGVIRTQVGRLAVACAAIADLLAWSLLAVTVALMGINRTEWRILLLVPYIVAMIWLVRPLLKRMAQAHAASGELTIQTLAGTLTGLLLSAGFTEWIGLHYIFGAFLFGIAMPRENAADLLAELQDKMGKFCSVLLLPAFFIVAGFTVNLSSIKGAAVGELGLILLVAIGGKFGTFFAARLAHLSVRDAGALAALSNTRGLTELIILTLALKLGVLDTGLYSMLVLMAVVTTAMTCPILQLIYRARSVEEDAQPVRVEEDVQDVPQVSRGRVPEVVSRLLSGQSR
jgi:Kef-type K+ transport system membrane component KefB